MTFPKLSSILRKSAPAADVPAVGFLTHVHTGQVGWVTEIRADGNEAVVSYPHQYRNADGRLVTYFVQDFWYSWEARQAMESDASPADLELWRIAKAG